MKLLQHEYLDDPLEMMVACLLKDKPTVKQPRIDQMRRDALSGMVVGQWTGVTRYCIESWMIFVMGQVVDAEDRELRAYLTWLLKYGLRPPAYTDGGNTAVVTPEPLRIMRLKG